MAAALPRLHRAALRGEEGKLKQFVNAGDDVNARDASGRTALLWAAHADHTNCVKLLLTAGADPSISDNAQNFPLYMASKNGNIALAKTVIEAKANIDAVIDCPDSGTALSVAAFTGDQAMVTFLLGAGCDTSITALGGHHPLTIASMEGRADVVALLLDAGADVNAVGATGITALIAGAENGSCDVIRILLERGAAVNQIGSDGWTAVFMAAQQGFDEVISILTAAGANVDQADRIKSTALHVSAFSGHPKCAAALLRKCVGKEFGGIISSSPGSM